MVSAITDRPNDWSGSYLLQMDRDTTSQGQLVWEVMETLVVGGGVLVTLSGGLVALVVPLSEKLFAGKKTEEISSAYGYGRKQIDSHLSPEFTSKNCHGALGTDNHQMHFNLDKCRLGLQHKKTLYLLGNSHAEHYRESAFLLHKNHNIGASITTEWYL